MIIGESMLILGLDWASLAICCKEPMLYLLHFIRFFACRLIERCTDARIFAPDNSTILL